MADSRVWFTVPALCLVCSTVFGSASPHGAPPHRTSIFVMLDLSGIPALATRQSLVAEVPKMQMVIASYLAEQNAFWEFVPVGSGTGLQPNQQRPLLRIKITTPGRVPESQLLTDLFLVTGSPPGRKLTRLPMEVYPPGHFKGDWRKPGAQLAKSFAEKIKEQLAGLIDEVRTVLKPIPIATGVASPPVDHRVEFPLPWLECCRFAHSRFEVFYRPPNRVLVLESSGTGIASSTGRFVAKHRRFREPGAQPQPMSRFPYPLRLAHYGEIKVVEFKETVRPTDRRIIVASEGP